MQIRGNTVILADGTDIRDVLRAAAEGCGVPHAMEVNTRGGRIHVVYASEHFTSDYGFENREDTQFARSMATAKVLAATAEALVAAGVKKSELMPHFYQVRDIGGSKVKVHTMGIWINPENVTTGTSAPVDTTGSRIETLTAELYNLYGDEREDECDIVLSELPSAPNVAVVKLGRLVNRMKAQQVESKTEPVADEVEANDIDDVEEL